MMTNCGNTLFYMNHLIIFTIKTVIHLKFLNFVYIIYFNQNPNQQANHEIIYDGYILQKKL